MALQLKNKAKEDTSSNNEQAKKGKYKRKRNVFGKRLTRFGLFGLIAFLAIALVSVKVFFTINQNKKQKKIESRLAQVDADIKKYKKKNKDDAYKNVGELIATLPTSFDRQAVSIDIDRMAILAHLEEDTYARDNVDAPKLPIECSVSTVKAKKIMTKFYGKLDDYNAAISMLNSLCNYEFENFYYIESFIYVEDRNLSKETTITIEFYTFYNEIELTSSSSTDTTTTTTK